MRSICASTPGDTQTGINVRYQCTLASAALATLSAWPSPRAAASEARMICMEILEEVLYIQSHGKEGFNGSHKMSG